MKNNKHAFCWIYTTLHDYHTCSCWFVMNCIQFDSIVSVKCQWDWLGMPSCNICISAKHSLVHWFYCLWPHANSATLLSWLRASAKTSPRDSNWNYTQWNTKMFPAKKTDKCICQFLPRFEVMEQTGVRFDRFAWPMRKDDTQALSRSRKARPFSSFPKILFPFH